ncbi:hypothetical protein L8P93_23430 [Enterobacter kobei]|uniref:hypothetical protein n=1 Tax=Enterobacter kobei TaxID=208224 RepID=UPI0020051AA6|nr:hypothetical protein [Enterobacter kobei]MCK7100483.1 hypothetical protein [Enterobacter kobei]
MTNNNGGPAFPVAGSEHNYPIEGMTLRDYFAAKAMQALVTSGLNTGAWGDYADLSKSAWSIAEAMLVEREAS